MTTLFILHPQGPKLFVSYKVETIKSQIKIKKIKKKSENKKELRPFFNSCDNYITQKLKEDE